MAKKIKKSKKQNKVKSVEIARSFSYKHNAGNYESRDFFCSMKVECKEKDAEVTAQNVYEFCKKMVLKDVNSYIAGSKNAFSDGVGKEAARIESTTADNQGEPLKKKAVQCPDCGIWVKATDKKCPRCAYKGDRNGQLEKTFEIRDLAQMDSTHEEA